MLPWLFSYIRNDLRSVAVHNFVIHFAVDIHVSKVHLMMMMVFVRVCLYSLYGMYIYIYIYPLVPYPHTYIALYHSHAKLSVTHTQTRNC